MRRGITLAVLCAATAAPQVAHAFCGFYVGGADTKLYNNATQVVLMRDGTRTALSMQNNYQGPPADFAMVVPVPVVLQKENVKTLPREVFEKIDTLDAPRLVEYWEQDPCRVEDPRRYEKMEAPMEDAEGAKAEPDKNLGVKIEAQFTVGEYEIVILSASDSMGLETWLRQSGYQIPKHAAPLLKPYVEAGMKFFVAKVDVKKVKFEHGQAMLSPLRFHYDSDQFMLPVRLGLVNSAGTQDLIVHILAPNQRFEVANYPNVTIPTNFDVAEAAKGEFASFYAALFDATLDTHKGSVITEYSWDAGSCDPCPTPPLEESELATFGADVMPSGGYSFVLTRLHARYGKDALGEDLVFKPAPAIMGGREYRDEKGQLEHGAKIATPDDGEVNNFQGRYAVRHPWTGPITCENPVRGRWGGPPNDPDNEDPNAGGGAKAALGLAFAPRDAVQLGAIVKEDVPEIGVKVGVVNPPGRVHSSRACACDVGGRGVEAGGAAALLIMCGGFVAGRRRRSR